MSWIHQALDLFLHLNTHLDSAAQNLGPWLYLLLFAIVFCETGLVVTPILPGDSLLFAFGALAAGGTTVKLPVVVVVLCIAANCGDCVNYLIGYRLGPKVFSRESSWLLNKKHLAEAQAFYDRHGRKTIILARFVPIVRNLRPFCGRHRPHALRALRGLQHRWRHILGRERLNGRLLFWQRPHRQT